MSRLFGYWKKVLNDLETLRKKRTPMTVGEAMRQHSITGKYPKDRKLRGQVKMMQLMALQMAKTIPSPPSGVQAECKEAKEDRPLSETFESVETPEWIVEGGGITGVRRFV
jgi:hypothetical protein